MITLFNGNFHKVLFNLTRSPHKDVQYNAAGIIGHLAMNGEAHTHQSSTFILVTSMYMYYMYMYTHLHVYVFTCSIFLLFGACINHLYVTDTSCS